MTPLLIILGVGAVLAFVAWLVLRLPDSTFKSDRKPDHSFPWNRGDDE